MIDRYFSAPKTLRRLRSGLSGAHIDGFADALTRDGYVTRPSSGTCERRPTWACSWSDGARRWRIWTRPPSARFVVIFDGVAVPPPMGAAMAITRPSACSAFRPI